MYFAIVFCTSLPLALTANLINEFFLFGEFVLSNTKQKEPMIRELFHNFIGSAS
ncbi:hypothetical protein GSU18_09225 [Campylobacter jejuni]|nr:hypothetical protein [Campylobacter jejuni]EDO8697271.1 hypothetical protein [Campylobacter jejuni]